MIDCERWVLAEAWLANGLRLEWSAESTARHGDNTWQGTAPNLYRYRGYGTWEVLRPHNFLQRRYGELEAPQLPTEDLRHELAHWLIATEEQRGQQNFGIPTDDRDLLAQDAERNAVAAERVIQSIVAAASRIAAMALGAKP